ncbi:DUF3427 domain-containing protein [Arcanobacterium phocae]|uniref:DUF3427 domain-containing protein n=1 Tax=Arcanobacterium phocae TaxID=131112 RepID=UPI001C0F326E|nr:DEAD/DEAH box helicase [Arcanobacterium phocae]
MLIPDSKLADSTVFGFLNKTHDSHDHIYDPELIWNDSEKLMLNAIRRELRQSEKFVFSIAFVTSSALAMLKQELLSAVARGVRGTIITSDYLGFNDPEVFEELYAIPGIDVYVFNQGGLGFHAKGYLFHHPDDETLTAIVGSSNLTEQALCVNHEWNLKFSAAPDGYITDEIQRAVQQQIQHSVLLTPEWISEYEQRRATMPRVDRRIVDVSADEHLSSTTEIVPNAMQKEALERLQELRDTGESKAVIISATGTGKTILAALAAKMFNPQRILFLVHREQILDKAIDEFERVLDQPHIHFGKVVGSVNETDRNYVFSTVQSMSREQRLQQFAPNHFDLIIVDEVHRSGGQTYQKILNHFSPDFLLGLTATPERTDGFNIFELFDFNVPYEIRLQAALEAKMLVPFHYYGITDYVDTQENLITDTSSLAQLTAVERIDHIVGMIERYGHTRNTKGLIFCSNVDEAHELSMLLNQRFAFGKQLRTLALEGDTPPKAREQAVRELEAGNLDYLLTVDIFNEGIDIPAVNQVVLLRNTQSAIIFTQQLGRGLRKAENKDHLRVLDFIGNYSNSYLIPIALFGDNSRNKDQIRRRLIGNRADNTIAGISSINFDEIAAQRVFESLSEAKISSMAHLKDDLRLLFQRLNRVPKLYDFAVHDTADPLLMANGHQLPKKSRTHSTYWQLLHKAKYVDRAPEKEQQAVLYMLSKEILPGKRPHELLLLEYLLKHGDIAIGDVSTLFSEQQVGGQLFQGALRSSVEAVLTLEFFTQPQKASYGNQPLITIEEERYMLHPELQDMLNEDSYFREHVVDIVKTGLYIARHREAWSSEMKIGFRYSRKDVCKMLGFASNQEGTLNGYKVDQVSKTCPIFVTYKKDEDISASIRYEDSFTSENVLHWYTRKNQRLTGREVVGILSGEFDIHVFVKKDDAEGIDFFYLGQATPSNEKQVKMRDDTGKLYDIVTMDLELGSPIEAHLFDYFEATSAAAHNESPLSISQV